MLAKIVILAVLVFLVVGVPSTSSALSVEVYVNGTLCSPGPTVASLTGPVVSTGTITRTTTLRLSSPFDCNGIRLACVNCTLAAPNTNTWRVIAQVSGGVLKMSVRNLRATATGTATATAPRSVRIRAISGSSNGEQDFLDVSPGPRSAGVTVTANFTGNPTAVGDTLAVTGSLGTATSSGIINPYPAGPTDLPNSLPSPSSGCNLPNCVFTVSGTTNIFDSYTEPSIDLRCPSEQAQCTPVLTAELNVNFIHTGDRVDLPNSVTAKGDEEPGQTSANIYKDDPPFDEFKAALQIFTVSKRFAFESSLTLGAGALSIDPTELAVQLALGSRLSTTIAGFKRKSSALWVFDGVVDLVFDGVVYRIRLAAAIKSLNQMGTKLGVAIGGSGVNLSAIGDQVLARLTIGDQTGYDPQLKPRFFAR